MPPRTVRQPSEDDPQIILMVELTPLHGTVYVLVSAVMNQKTGWEAASRADHSLRSLGGLDAIAPIGISDEPACVSEIIWELSTEMPEGSDPAASPVHQQALRLAIDAIVEPHLETMGTDNLVVVDTQGNPPAL